MAFHTEGPVPQRGAIALAVLLALVPTERLLAQTVAADLTSPRIATNQESTDVGTALKLLEGQVQQARQEAMYSNLFLFGDTPERRDLFERSFAFLGKYLKP